MFQYLVAISFSSVSQQFGDMLSRESRMKKVTQNPFECDLGMLKIRVVNLAFCCGSKVARGRCQMTVF
jgi:hypothetical protein